MARKKACFASSVCCTDAFSALSFEAQALYYRLGFEADSDGALGNVRQVARMTGAGMEAVEELEAAGLLLEVGDVYFVTHWWVNNNRDRYNYRAGDHEEELAKLELGDNRTYRLFKGTLEEPSLTKDGNQTDVSLQYKSIQINTSPSKSIPENQIKENQNQEKSPPSTVRCPDCGKNTAGVLEHGSLHGYCDTHGDFYLPLEGVE